MKSTTPLHIALIPDGNRRWAKKQLLNPWKGHEKAIENFRSSLEWCYNNPQIGTLTIWCFSTENWKRDATEVDMLMKLFVQYLETERDMFSAKNIRVLHSGRTDRLPKNLVQLLQDIQAETEQNTAFTFHLAIDYGGKDEILRAIHKYKADEKPENITEENFAAYTDQPSVQNIDLIIRTSGEQRTSNFFLWQSAYAEWIFVPQKFPEFTTEDLQQCVENFTKRTRRFGS